MPCTCYLPPTVSLTADGDAISSRWVWPSGTVGVGAAEKVVEPYTGLLPAPCKHTPEMDTCEEPTGWASSPQANTTAELIRLIALAIASPMRRQGFDHIDPKLLQESCAVSANRLKWSQS